MGLAPQGKAPSSGWAGSSGARRIRERDPMGGDSKPLNAGASGWSAFDLDRAGVIAFSPSEIPSGVRRSLEERFGGTALRGVILEEPDDLHDWPEGTPSPEVVLCRSKAAPHRYRAFRDRGEIDDSTFEETGKTYAVFSDWDRFARTLISLDEVASHGDPGEPPEIDEMLRRIGQMTDQTIASEST